MINVLFLGRGLIANRCFDLLCSRPQEFVVKGVVSNAQVNKDWSGSDYLHVWAKHNEIPFVDNDRRHTDLLLRLIKDQDIQMLISVQHIWILPPEILRAVDGQAYNLHNALLPNYGGFYTIAHELYNEERYHGCTIHQMNEVPDSGVILVDGQVGIGPLDTATDVYRKSVYLATALFDCFLSEKLYLRKNNNVVGPSMFYSKSDYQRLVADPTTAKRVLDFDFEAATEGL